MLRSLAIWSLVCGFAQAADVSDPTKLMFAADRLAKSIDIISLDDLTVTHRIEPSIMVDHIVATPFAPVLAYSSIGERKLVFYDLEKKSENRTIDLPVVPRHMVLDTTGSKIAITDDVDGGFALVHAYSKEILLLLPDFPATADVLFDPNDVDIYYSNVKAGTLGLLDINTSETYEMQIVDEANQMLSSPSRSLDGRYVYVSNASTGEIYSMNAYSKVIFNTFETNGIPARPYTTPEGVFLYMMDRENGRLVTIEQQGFTKYADLDLGEGVDLVTVGRFDRLNLFSSRHNRHWHIVDNVSKKVVKRGTFAGLPLNALGSADGRYAYVAFSDVAKVAVVDLEKQSITLVDATQNGSRAFTIGLSNNVCH